VWIHVLLVVPRYIIVDCFVVYISDDSTKESSCVLFDGNVPAGCIFET
jgi:hypothetical protein